MEVYSEDVSKVYKNDKYNGIEYIIYKDGKKEFVNSADKSHIKVQKYADNQSNQKEGRANKQFIKYGTSSVLVEDYLKDKELKYEKKEEKEEVDGLQDPKEEEEKEEEKEEEIKTFSFKDIPIFILKKRNYYYY